MLRGMRQASSSWLGKIVMASVVGILIISLRHLGHRRHFPRLRGVHRGQGRPDRDLDRPVPGALHRAAAAVRPPDRPADHARPGARVRPRAAAARPDDRLCGARRARPAARLGISDAEVAKRITEDPAFRGFNGQFDHSVFLQRVRDIGFTEQRFVYEQRQTTHAPPDRGSDRGRVGAAQDRGAGARSFPRRGAQRRLRDARRRQGRRRCRCRRRRSSRPISRSTRSRSGRPNTARS